MKLALLLSGAAVVAATAAQAAPAPRSFQVDYNGAAVAGANGMFFGLRCGAQCITFTTARSGERTMRISVTDATGRPIGWMAETDAAAHTGCGTGSLVVGPGQTWWVSTVVLDRCQAAPTHGTLTVRLSTR